MAACSTAMDVEGATEHEQLLVATTTPSPRFSRPVLALAAVSAIVLLFAVPWKVATTAPAERAPFEVAMQHLSEARAEALFQVY